MKSFFHTAPNVSATITVKADRLKSAFLKGHGPTTDYRVASCNNFDYNQCC